MLRQTAIATTILLAVTAIAAEAQPAKPVQPPPQPLPKVTYPVNLGAPSVAITNGIATAKVYLTGDDKAFYHGTRFDQSGVVGNLTVGGQDFYGAWVERYSPETHDYAALSDTVFVGGPDSSITGPAEEYNTTDGKALGYDAAPAGGTFVKIGVGVLRKPDSKPYDHYFHYQIVDSGKRTVTHTGNSVTFTQTLNDPASGYGYVYTKTLTLVPGKPQMILSHTLRDTGSKPITTQVYDHNFVRLSAGDADLSLSMPFAPQLATTPPADLMAVEGKGLRFLRPLTGAQRINSLITGYGGDAKDYDFTIRNAKTGAAVRVQGDRPLTKINLFCVRTTMAVEPYVDVNVPVGGTMAWRYTYTYTAPHA